MLQMILTVNVSLFDASPLIRSYQVHHNLAENCARTCIPAHKSPEKATYSEADLQSHASDSLENAACRYPPNLTATGSLASEIMFSV